MKTLTDRKWPGYTLDQLQAQRAINDRRIEVQKATLNHEINLLRNDRANQTGVLKKMMNGLTYLDYAVLGVSAFKRISSLVSLFSKKKK